MSITTTMKLYLTKWNWIMERRCAYIQFSYNERKNDTQIGTF